MRYYVYTLSYPDGTPFYVGKGSKNSSGDRIHSHESEARGSKPTSNPFKCRVIRKIWREGGEVLKDKIAFFDDEERAFFFEQWVIKALRADGVRLTNLTDGGDGVRGYTFSPEAIERIASSHRGKKLPAYRVEQIRALHKGRKRPPETGKRISAKRKGQRTTYKTWEGFISPDGTVYRDIVSLHDFCAEHNLTSQHMYAVAQGKRQQHKGWRRLHAANVSQ